MTEMHQHITKNELGRDFVVGDIHGCYELLVGQLRYVGFDKNKDRLFSVGDLVDRGPDSERCLDLLKMPWFYMVRGNHEEMMINACRGDERHWWTSYGIWTRDIDPKILNQWAGLLIDLPITLTLQLEGFQVGLCHAEPDGKNWHEMRENRNSADVMMWGRRVLRNPPEYDVDGVDLTIHGHTPVDQPVWVGNRYFMDTGAGHGQALTVRKIDDIWAEYSAQKSLFGS